MYRILISFVKFKLYYYLKLNFYKWKFKNNKYLYNIYKDGFCVIPNFIKPKECDFIKNEITKYIKKNPKKIYNYHNYDYRIFSFNKVSKISNKFRNNKFIKKIILNYNNENNIKHSFTMGSKLLAKKNNRGSGGGWHRDNLNGPFPKAIIYLSNVKYDNGPFQYVKGSNNFFNTIEFLFFSKIGYNKKEFNNRLIKKYSKLKKKMIKTLIGKKGTLIIFDSSGIHRGMPIKKEKRYSLTNYYYFDSKGGKGFKHI